MKRKLDKMQYSCVNCSVPSANTQLQALFSVSPYATILRMRQHVELDDDRCELLNRDWMFHPHIKYVSAQLLAGSIIRNNITGISVMANTIEMYGRKKAVDAHHESFGNRKGMSIPTSLPPPMQTRYPNVWPFTLNTFDGPKLIIGTLSSNALVTLTTRLDQLEKPSVGAITVNVQLSHTEHSLSTSIFLDKESVVRALSLAKNIDATSIASSNLLGQLRQLRTKFHQPTTLWYLSFLTPMVGYDKHTISPVHLVPLPKHANANHTLYSRWTTLTEGAILVPEFSRVLPSAS
ncbi:hypothetical protein DFQ28_003888 [Apophysomyces sp. BC1034]|nr:hypothetical protein DFQ28_003888 [Apophysomyces sp. BC1034]